MIRFLHAADLHLDSKLNTMLGPDQLKTRRAELTDTLERLAALAEDLGCRALLLCGDIFDTPKVTKTTMKKVRAVIDSHSDLDFLVLYGNHDAGLTISSQDGYEAPNLKSFSQKAWTTYLYGDVAISGTENLLKAGTENIPHSEGPHLVMLHGEIRDGVAMSDGVIPLGRFRGRGIDYLALGHYHSYQEGPVDERAVYVYSGCPEGRGFDETGVKGAVLIEIENGHVYHTFQKTSLRVIHDLAVDITGLDSFESIEAKVNETVADCAREDIIRVRLTGRLSEDTEFYHEILENELTSRFFSARIDYALTYGTDEGGTANPSVSLRHEFIETVHKEKDLSDEDKEAIIMYGLRALDNDIIG